MCQVMQSSNEIFDKFPMEPPKNESAPSIETNPPLPSVHTVQTREEIVDEKPSLGIFGWETLDQVPIPYIVRDGQKFVSTRIVSEQVFTRFDQFFTDEVTGCFRLDTVPATQPEADLLNDINENHADRHFGNTKFTISDRLLLLADCVELKAFLDFCVKILVLEIKDLDFKRCGFVSIDSRLVPYVLQSGKIYVPLFYFDGQSQYLEERSRLIDGWDLTYLKFCCAMHDINKSFYNDSNCNVVAFDEVLKLFPSNIKVETGWPEKINTKLLVRPPNNQNEKKGEVMVKDLATMMEFALQSYSKQSPPPENGVSKRRLQRRNSAISVPHARQIQTPPTSHSVPDHLSQRPTQASSRIHPESNQQTWWNNFTDAALICRVPAGPPQQTSKYYQQLNHQNIPTSATNASPQYNCPLQAMNPRNVPVTTTEDVRHQYNAYPQTPSIRNVMTSPRVVSRQQYNTAFPQMENATTGATAQQQYRNAYPPNVANPQIPNVGNVTSSREINRQQCNTGFPQLANTTTVAAAQQQYSNAYSTNVANPRIPIVGNVASSREINRQQCNTGFPQLANTTTVTAAQQQYSNAYSTNVTNPRIPNVGNMASSREINRQQCNTGFPQLENTTTVAAAQQQYSNAYSTNVANPRIPNVGNVASSREVNRPQYNTGFPPMPNTSTVSTAQQQYNNVYSTSVTNPRTPNVGNVTSPQEVNRQQYNIGFPQKPSTTTVATGQQQYSNAYSINVANARGAPPSYWQHQNNRMGGGNYRLQVTPGMTTNMETLRVGNAGCAPSTSYNLPTRETVQHGINFSNQQATSWHQ